MVKTIVDRTSLDFLSLSVSVEAAIASWIATFFILASVPSVIFSFLAIFLKSAGVMIMRPAASVCIVLGSTAGFVCEPSGMHNDFYFAIASQIAQ